jgi:hypothetical protein
MARQPPAWLGRSFIVAGLAAAPALSGHLPQARAAAAQIASHCDPDLPVSTSNPLGYRQRGDRCEGVFVQDVSATRLTVVSFGQFDITGLGAGEDAWQLEWEPVPDDVHIRAYALRPRTYYRMDTWRPGGSRSYRWPTSVVTALNLTPADIGIVATAQRMIGGRPREVYLPLRIGRPTGPEGTYELRIVPGVELSEVFVGMSAVGTDGTPGATTPMPLNHGYYPAGRSISVPVGPLAAPGPYFVEIGATLRGGGAVSHELWIVHPPERQVPE